MVGTAVAVASEGTVGTTVGMLVGIVAVATGSVAVTGGMVTVGNVTVGRATVGVWTVARVPVGIG